MESKLRAWLDEDLAFISTVEAEPVEWLWHHRIPKGEITVIDGDPGVGKSTLGVEIAATVSTGRNWCDGAPSMRGCVLLFSGEDSIARTIRPRLEAAKADLTLVAANKKHVTLPDDVAYISSKVEKYDAQAIVIDPFMAFLSSRVNSWKDQDIRTALRPLQELASATNAAVIIVRHLNKGSGGNALYRGGGSIGIIGAARAGFLVEVDPDDESLRILASVKSNLGPKPPALAFRMETLPGDINRIVWVGESRHTAETLLDGTEGRKLRGAKEFLEETLAAGPVASETLIDQAKAAGISKDKVWEAKKALGVVAKRQGFGEGSRWMWSLTAKHPDSSI